VTVVAHQVGHRTAVLFDLDGTLIDSEPVWAAANTTLIRSRDADMTDEVLRNLNGLDSTLAMRYLHEHFGWTGRDVANDVAWIEEQVRLRYAEGVNWLPGAKDLLAAFRAEGFAIGLVTSTYRALVAFVLAEAVPGCFDVVVCGDDGLPPKPDPAPYAAAIRHLGLPPSACVAVEDSWRGVASAKAAECKVVHVSQHGLAPTADRHIDKLAELTADVVRDMVGLVAH
jgi:HAD superfamily hydrolase (TIGR01509 family)